MKLRVGTRASRLAMSQARQACEGLCAATRSIEYELVPVRTSGDAVTDRPLREAGGKGLFVKELDDALAAGSIDCAVHSLKDVPTVLPEGIVIACVPERGDPRDELISRSGWGLADLPSGTRVGTGSLRRRAQLLGANAGVDVSDIRGNVETRLHKVLSGDYGATFLASAGLDRLAIDVAPAKRVALDPETFVPAPGQGALCFTARGDDDSVCEAVSMIQDDSSLAASRAERACAETLGGSCFLPVGAYAHSQGDRIRLTAIVCSPDATKVVRETADASVSEASELGMELGRRLIAAGAGEIIAALEVAE